VSGLVTVMLWAHVASASWWILASFTMALAGAVLSADSVEGREFIVRVVPKLNWANNAAALTVLVTGLVNLYGAGRNRGFDFPTSFVRVLAVKIVLYAAMFAMLRASISAARKLVAQVDGQAGAGEGVGSGRLAAFSAITALVGAAAMLLGVWLAGE
jgi:hypothetical protein